ncbi:MAG TPA: site-specific DNA-methyltransferase, partial [Spirochaetota bacterium]|nr:site-specific DNA-methyltransferase [Spirochaetota bacterium]
MFYNCDCIEGAKKYLPDNSIDLIITDPPYGIDGNKLDKHYNRNENNVIEGYVEIPKSEYADFTEKWIGQAERVLKPGGSIYIVSGYTNLRHILNSLANTKLIEKNHIIWKYNFGVYTSKKFISSHYHILYYVKPGEKPTFNTFAFYSDSEKSANGGSLNYQDREDVWI